MKTTVNPKRVTEECWMIQFMGIEACEKCEYKDSHLCSGKRIRKTGKNKNGHNVPLGWLSYDNPF